MKKAMKIVSAALIGALLVLAAGCTDADRAGIYAYGDEAHIVCWNGGEVVYDDYSTGKVSPYKSGISFRSKTTKKYVRVFADCIVTVQ